MAAADLSRSRAAASRSTKGLFFISTLLCLFCFVSSSSYKESLDRLDHTEKLVKFFLKIKKEMDQFKIINPTDLEQFEEMGLEFMDYVDQVLSSPEMMGLDRLLRDGYPSMDALVDCFRTFWKEFKRQVHRDLKKIRRMNSEL